MNSLRCLGLLVLALLVGTGDSFGQGLEKVRIVYASRGLPFFSAFVAKERMVLNHYGLVPLKDVQILSIGEEKVILDALVAGRINGAMLSPPWPFEAEKHGFKIILKASDVVQFPFAGICTTTDKIKNQREQIKKVIRAEIDSLRFIRERRQETIDIIVRLFKMDKEIAQKSYDFASVFFSRAARIQPEAARQLIALEKENGDIKGDVDVGHIAELSLVGEVLR